MDTVCVNIDECNENFVLANNVVNRNGLIIAKQGAQLSQYIISIIKRHGIHKVSVYKDESDKDDIPYDKLFLDNYSVSVGRTKEILSDLTTGKTLDVSKVDDVCNSIFSEVKNSDSIIKCIGSIKDFDDYTYTHSVNVAFYSMLIGKWMGFSTDEIKDAIKAGFLHDIGKTRVPIEILNKKEMLLNREFDIIKKHAEHGYAIAESLEQIDNDVKEAILVHHEREDGSGYPYGRNGRDINIYGKIVSIADVFDAMTSNRVYKKAAAPFEVFEMFMIKDISKFKQDIVRIFISNITVYFVGMKVQLNSGKTGVIVHIPPHELNYPIIFDGTNYIDTARDKSIKIMGFM